MPRNIPIGWKAARLSLASIVSFLVDKSLKT